MYFSGFILVFCFNRMIFFLINGYSHFFFLLNMPGMIIAAAIINNIIIAA